MSLERMTQVAIELMKLRVSQAGVSQILANYELEEIERQLIYLPYRKAKRPQAFIIEAIRNRYSPPKEFTYARHMRHQDGSDSASESDDFANAL